jgi:hypothetical protein
MTMAIATAYAWIVCGIGTTYRLNEYWQSTPSGLSLVFHAMHIPMFVLSFIYAEVATYVAVMLLLLCWYQATYRWDRISS